MTTAPVLLDMGRRSRLRFEKHGDWPLVRLRCGILTTTRL